MFDSNYISFVAHCNVCINTKKDPSPACGNGISEMVQLFNYAVVQTQPCSTDKNQDKGQ